MSWQPIKTVPRDIDVLLYFPPIRATRERGVGSASRMIVGKVWQWDHRDFPPTHWMPLPEPPEQSQ
jgi:hypothetical protein